MGTVKAKSLIEKHGFKDSDLTTPEHDKILFWSVDNIEQIINDIIIKDKAKFKVEILKTEYAIMNYSGYSNSKSVIGFLDLFVRIKTEANEEFQSQKRTIAIEIKSKILSVGETIRQLNFYKSFSEYDYYLIISPDDRFIDFFEKQGFKFYKYKENSELF